MVGVGECWRQSSPSTTNPTVELTERFAETIAARLGRSITWDPKTEQISGDDMAAAMLGREQRKGFEIPKLAMTASK